MFKSSASGKIVEAGISNWLVEVASGELFSIPIAYLYRSIIFSFLVSASGLK